MAGRRPARAAGRPRRARGADPPAKEVVRAALAAAGSGRSACARSAHSTAARPGAVRVHCLRLRASPSATPMDSSSRRTSVIVLGTAWLEAARLRCATPRRRSPRPPARGGRGSPAPGRQHQLGDRRKERVAIEEALEDADAAVGARRPERPADDRPCAARSENPLLHRLEKRRTVRASRRRCAPGGCGWPTTVGDQCWRRMFSPRCVPTVAMCPSVVRISRSSSASTARPILRTRWLSVSCSRCGAARGWWWCASTCAGRWSVSKAASRHGALPRERARSWATNADGSPVRFLRPRLRRVCSLLPPPSGPSRSSSARPDGGAVGGREVSGWCAVARLAR